MNIHIAVLLPEGGTVVFSVNNSDVNDNKSCGRLIVVSGLCHIFRLVRLTSASGSVNQ